MKSAEDVTARDARRAREGPDRHPGLRRDHRRRAARGRPTLVCGGAGCGKTLFAHGVPGPRRRRVRRARRLHGASRRPPRSSARTSPRSASTSRRSAAGQARHRPRPHRAERDRGDRRVRPRGALHPPRRTPSTRSAPSGSCSTPSRRSSPACPNAAILRAELRRLFRWLKEKGVTAVDHRRARRRHAHPPRPRGVRLRLRDPARPPGQRPDLDPAPAGRQVPRLDARHQRVPVPDRRARASPSCRSRRSGSSTHASDRAHLHRHRQRLDAMLGGQGVYRGSSVLVSGTAGTGKTSLAAHFVDAACRRGERCLLLRLRGVAEPDRPQHALDRHRPGDAGSRTGCSASTPRARTLHGLEMHLVRMHRAIDEFRPERRRRRSDHATSSASAPRYRGAADADAPHRFPEGTAASPPSSPA